MRKFAIIVGVAFISFQFVSQFTSTRCHHTFWV